MISQVTSISKKCFDLFVSVKTLYSLLYSYIVVPFSTGPFSSVVLTFDQPGKVITANSNEWGFLKGRKTKTTPTLHVYVSIAPFLKCDGTAISIFSKYDGVRCGLCWVMSWHDTKRNCLYILQKCANLHASQRPQLQMHVSFQWFTILLHPVNI